MNPTEKPDDYEIQLARVEGIKSFPMRIVKAHGHYATEAEARAEYDKLPAGNRRLVRNTYNWKGILVRSAPLECDWR